MKKSICEQRGLARTQRPVRTQIEMQFLSLDQWLDKDHRARIIWQYVESLDLSLLYACIKATQGHVGRNPIDPRILFALWLLATLEGITSARRLAELTKRDIPYMWICGHVTVNYHRLSDFRVDHGELLEHILTDSIAVLLHQKLISLDVVAQDGMRVRASAGASSFRRAETLDDCLRKAKTHLKNINAQHENDPSGENRRSQAAAKRAARERVRRVERAHEELEELKAQRRANRSGKIRSEPRASITDPDARRTKMADGGFRPAMNVQFASEGESRMIIGVDVVKQGSDQGQMALMYHRIQESYTQTPTHYLVDGGFTKKEDIKELDSHGTQVYGALANAQKQIDEGKDPYSAKEGDSPAMVRFRERMGTKKAQEIYSRRSGIAEFPNAECRNRGLHQFRVRGRVKAKAQTLWYALAFNFNRMRHLGYLETVMTS